jgi:hypothetical protein
MSGAALNNSRSSGSLAGGSAGWDDYGYHHDDVVEPSSLVPVPRGGDQTGRGCRGREGREHTPVARRSRHFTGTDCACEEVPTWWGFCFHEEACASCGIMLRRFIPPEECPDISPA